MLPSTKSHGGEERNGRHSLDSVDTNEPFKLLLKYTFAVHSMLTKNSIQTRLSGIGLPTTIKETEEVVTHISNMIAMEKHLRDVSLRIKGNRSVARLPVLVIRNGGVHLLFDLTHVWCRLVDFYTIQHQGASTTPCVPLVRLSPPKHLFKQWGIIETLLIILIISQPNFLLHPC